ncbi:polyprenyl synthetase family protein [Thauera sinica]|uniref:Polyprenyl synthetase family protein n=1 Tax=Thauera sinica TaxID=2665146 RepID=A0ABW1AWG0_9RHOO|nr:farnesyl diphosphate synthase [Thauera sp. K11]ATE60259.1 geranyl transferase [Thauera sp. K11]
MSIAIAESAHGGFTDWMGHIQQRTETALAALLPDASISPQRLHSAMRYAVLGGGKRVRALLVHAAGELAGAAPVRLDRLACAVEFIHAYSLVHDDMPCMDDDVLRRGKPTVHVEYDEATALLAGDALQTLAFQVLADAQVADSPAGQLAMVGLLASASGSRGMAGGQAIDLESVGKQLSREELEFMHVHKTGALIRASVLLGARAGDPIADEDLRHLDHYAKLVGLLFQVVDDILDTVADTATLGKTAGKDADNDKPTYVSLLGLQDARRLAREMLADAHAALAPLGPRAARLGALADYIVHRTF